MGDTGFEDHFSACAADYRAFRPQYPPQLFDWLAAQAPSRERVWDCATGNGQAASALAGRFERVIATDASRAQLRSAPGHARVHYCACRAERAALAGASVDLVTVAQALHWLGLAPFYAEARRVLRPGGVLAAWTYGLVTVTAPVDRVLQRLYTDIVGPYWPPERRLVDEGYARLWFPWAPLPPPSLRMEATWGLPALVGYLQTWSAVQRFRAAAGYDPVAAIVNDLERVWGSVERRRVAWPLYVLAGQRA